MKEGRPFGRPSGSSFPARLRRRRLRSVVTLGDRRRLVLLGVLLRYELAGLSTAVLSDLLVSHCCSPLGSWGLVIATAQRNTAGPTKGGVDGPVTG